MILTLRNNDIVISRNSLENVNRAKIFLNFEDFDFKQNYYAKIFFNGQDLEKISENVFKINPRCFNGNILNIKVMIYSGTEVVKEFECSSRLEQYFSFGTQPYEKIPEVLIEINKEINKLENRIIELEKEKNVI